MCHQRHFADWEPAPIPDIPIPEVASGRYGAIYLIDRPGATQSVIYPGRLAAPTAREGDVSFKAMNQILGGSHVSRINWTLREEKHWAYVTRTSIVDARGQRLYGGRIPVQKDKTAEAMRVVRDIMRNIRNAALLRTWRWTGRKRGWHSDYPASGNPTRGWRAQLPRRFSMGSIGTPSIRSHDE